MEYKQLRRNWRVNLGPPETIANRVHFSNTSFRIPKTNQGLDYPEDIQTVYVICASVFPEKSIVE